MAAVLLRRSGGRIEVRKVLETSLSLDLLKDEPELVGREIRNCLDGERIREKRCVICLPLKWAFTFQTELPELSKSDRETFLSVQAERELPFPPQDLSISASRFETPDGAGNALVATVSKNHLAVLLKALKAAKLRPVSLTLGATTLTEKRQRSANGAVDLLVTKTGIDVAVSAGGGIVSLRTLEEVVAVEKNKQVLDVDLLARQIRVTLGRMQDELRNTVKELHIFGPLETARALAEDLRGSMANLGMSISVSDVALGAPVAGSLELDRARSLAPTALAAAGRGLLGRTFDFEFLPPRLNRFKQMTGRLPFRVTFWLAAAGAFLALALGITFLIQYLYLAHLESRWQSIESSVLEVERTQEKIKKFRPWYDDSVRSLVIARSLTEAFPEEGTVWAKKMVIKPHSQFENLAEVLCMGFASGNQQWLEMLDRLRETTGIEELHFQQVQGDTPLAFTLNFSWNAETAYDN
jgi:hypothetical protein